MKRSDVYNLIDGERDYQDKQPHRPEADNETPISSWLIYIEKKLNEAKENIYWLKKDDALENVRKIAGLCVACMEFNETKAREK